MVDSGASACCLALRCVLNSSKLKYIHREAYVGDQLFDAGGNPISPEFVITVSLQLGEPKLSVFQRFVVVKTLPFSCIMGQTFLNTLNSWTVDNRRKFLILDFEIKKKEKKKVIVNNRSSEVSFSALPPESSADSIQFITTDRCRVMPRESIEVNVRATGPQLLAFRPATNITVITEGSMDVMGRLNIEVLPSVALLTHNNCTTKMVIHNQSDEVKNIKK